VTLVAAAAGLLQPLQPLHCIHAQRTRTRACDRYIVLTDLSPRDRPGNYVSAYSSALGVSAAAVLCGELIPMPGAKTVPLAGRVAACTALPLLCTAFAVLREAAKVGPSKLQTLPIQRLNLGLALSSVASVVIGRPLPVLSVIVARAGSALLCLEVWSQGAAAKAGDPAAEVTAALRGVFEMCRRTIQLLLSERAAALFSAIALGYLALLLAVVLAPKAALAALWPAVTPLGATGARAAASAAGLASVVSLNLADVSAGRKASSSGDELRPWRWLNRALLLSAALHLMVQALAGLTGGGGEGALAALWSSGRVCAQSCTLAAVQVLHVATIALCAWATPLFCS